MKVQEKVRQYLVCKVKLILKIKILEYNICTQQSITYITCMYVCCILKFIRFTMYLKKFSKDFEKTFLVYICSFVYLNNIFIKENNDFFLARPCCGQGIYGSHCCRKSFGSNDF